MKIRFTVLLFFVFVIVAVGGAYAQFATPEHAIKYRKSVMFLIAQHFGRMGTMVKETAAYSKGAFVDNAVLVETLSRLPWQAFFVPESDKGDTTLKASAFQQQAKFNELAQTFESQAAKLVSSAQSGDLNATKTQFGEVAKSCKACHTEFRNR